MSISGIGGNYSTPPSVYLNNQVNVLLLELDALENELEGLPPGSPKAAALKAEIAVIVNELLMLEQEASSLKGGGAGTPITISTSSSSISPDLEQLVKMLEEQEEELEQELEAISSQLTALKNELKQLPPGSPQAAAIKAEIAALNTKVGVDEKEAYSIHDRIVSFENGGVNA